ncbi:unnamed protein product [Closterium sp. Naga37s-1]|nr:unnamed protein product [Closterium sp. Naga37s-1]
MLFACPTVTTFLYKNQQRTGVRTQDFLGRIGEKRALVLKLGGALGGRGGVGWSEREFGLKWKGVLQGWRERVAVLTGAGVSAASGVPTFRGAGGLWRTYDATVGAMPRWVPCHGGCHATVGAMPRWVPCHGGCHATVGAMPRWVPCHGGCHATVGVMPWWVPCHGGCHATVGAMPQWVPCHLACFMKFVLVDVMRRGGSLACCFAVCGTHNAISVVTPLPPFPRPRPLHLRPSHPCAHRSWQPHRRLRRTHRWCGSSTTTAGAALLLPTTTIATSFLPSATTAGSCLKSVVARCTPNAGHEALVQLEQRCQREGKAFTLLTQHRNVDGLPCPAGAVTSSAACTTAVTCALVLPARPCCTPRCALAACPPSPPTHRHPSPSPGKPQNVDGLHTAAGSSALVELHGCLWRTRCLTWSAQRGCQGSEHSSQGPAALHQAARECSFKPTLQWVASAGRGVVRGVFGSAGGASSRGRPHWLRPAARCRNIRCCASSSGVCSGRAGGRGAGAEFNAEATALSPLATWKFPGDSAMLLPLVLG